MQLPTSILRRESAPVVGLLEAIAVYEIYQHALPSTADTRGVSSYNSDIETSRKHAAIEATVLLAAVFAVTRDFNAFIIGGIATVLVDASFKHANAVSPATGSVDTAGGQSISNVYPLGSGDYESETG